MEMMSGKENPIFSRISARKRRCDSGLSIKSILRPHRMVIASRDLRSSKKDHTISSRSRLVRFADKQQDPEVRLLAPRPIGMVSACSLISMDRNESIHVSIVLPRRKSATKSPQRPGGSFAPDSVSVDNTALVCGPTSHANKEPILIPRERGLLVLPHNGENHPLSHQMQLAGWPISGLTSSTLAFQESLQRSSWRHGGQAQKSNTQLHGKDGIAGVLNRAKILFQPL